MGRQDEQLEDLLRALEEVERASSRFETVPATFDREYQRVRASIGTLSEKLAGVQYRIRDLEQRSAGERRRQYTIQGISRFIGRLEADLRVFERIGENSELRAQIAALRSKISELQLEVAEARIKERLGRALKAVESGAEKLLPLLDVERPSDPITLLVDDLGLKIGGEDRDDYLWEIGSGSNWLSYHVAVTLGLQTYFSRDTECPVPNFVIYDQPSQVYFPKVLNEQDPDNPDPEFRDADVVAVRKVFNAMRIAISASDRVKLQVVVLDHAPRSVWDGLRDVELVEEWRNGEKLVPTSWIRSH